MTDRELMQEALEAMLSAINAGDWKVDGACDPHATIVRLTNRLAQPEQDSGGCRRCGGVGCDACDARCLMQLEWHSLAGTKREWFDGMVEATFAAGNDETVSVITHESVKDVALNYLPLRDRLAQPEPVHASDMSQERVDETAKREHEFFCPRCGHCCREWVGLTEHMKIKLADRFHISMDAVEAIEAKLKEKNT